ncbi:MAG: RHS repeat-associated core domain-containing protein [Pyrinomonadaceae bacterium]
MNVTNGNMYLQQTDYQLPGVGPSIDFTRTYNSSRQVSGVFGPGWSTIYDERIYLYEDHVVSLVLSDGRTVHGGRITTATNIFQPISTNFYGTTVANSDGTFTVTFKDGSIHQFNSLGRLSSLIDRNNNQTTLTYDGAGHLSAVTDTFGRSISVTTDTMGRITHVSDSVGTIADYFYDGTGDDALALRSVIYPDGSKFTFGHTVISGKQLMTTVTDAMNHVVEHHDYDGNGRAITSERQGGVDKYSLNYVTVNDLGVSQTDVTDAEGRVTKFTYQTINGTKLVTRVEGSCGCSGGSSEVQQWTYDNKGNVLVKTNALNQLTTSTYDANGNALTRTDLDGTRTYTYNSFSQLLTANDQMGGVTTMTYDPLGNLLTVKDALNQTTTFTSNSRGQITSVKDARTDSINITTFDYENGPNLLTKTDALGHATTFTYWPRGWLKTVSDGVTQAGPSVILTTQFEYDLVGRAKKTIYPDPAHNFVENVYDLAGRLTSAKDARGKITTYAYYDTELDFRLKSITDPLGNVTTFGYTPMSQLAFRTDALSQQTDYEYDEFSRLKKVTYPAASVTAPRLYEEFVEYDALGRIKKYKDTAGRFTNYTYDDVNRVNTVVDPLSQTTKFQYNQRHQLLKVTDALLQEYQFANDALGRVTSLTRGGGTRGYSYDPVGNLVQRTDYNGTVTNYTYDKLNRLNNITYADSTGATYNYDEISRLVSATNQNGPVSFVYDHRGRVVNTTDVFDRTIAYTFDANGNRTSLALGATVGITYDTYDNANRLQQMTDNAGGVYGFNYDAINRPTSRTLPNGITTSASYDRISRLTELKNAIGSSTINDFQFSYNSASDITQITEPARTRTFVNDEVHRLTSATNSAGSNESYTYDSVGNRTASHLSATYGLQPFNKLVSTQSAQYTYDANGNMTSRFDAAGRWYFYWDAENRLVRVVKPGWRPVSYRTITYAYDALGRRIERRSKTGGTESYTYDGQDVILDQNSSGAQTTYINGPGIDNKLKRTSGGASSYFLQDHLGSTVGLTDANGSVTASATYDGYGRQTGTLPTRYGFTGREMDPETGLMFYRARWYDPTLGRSISEDPIGFLGGDINYYGYVRNNPLRFRDPFGLRRCDPVTGALVGAGIGGAIGIGLGAAFGPAIGAQLGIQIGGGGGLVVAGPAGALSGGGLGALVGAAGGLIFGPIGGGAIGAGLGGYAGYSFCNGGGGACDVSPPFVPGPPSAPLPPPMPFPMADNWKYVPRYTPYPRIPPLWQPEPPDPDEDKRCWDKCQHLLKSPTGDRQSSEYHKCYDECRGWL